MAEGARRRFGADLAVATTGIAGPGGATEAKPAGLVFLGLAAAPPAGGGTGTTVESHQFWGNRRNVRALAAVRALEMLRQRALGAR
jgi:nicotinamide-nucleotide amidase